ncbi:hypothetical protein GCM10027517_16830 [Phycicoccus ginsengisoli]
MALRVLPRRLVRPVGDGAADVRLGLGVTVGLGLVVVVGAVVVGVELGVAAGDVVVVLASEVVGAGVEAPAPRSVAWAQPVTRTRSSPNQSVRRIRAP